MEAKSMKDSRCVKISNVFPPDTNNHNTLFGGKLMSMIDDIASLAAKRHSRRDVVTASTDSVDFLRPIHAGNSVSLESYVTFTGRTSMEVFVKVVTEDLKTGEKNIAATSFLTFVALDDEGNPTAIPNIYPETEEEKKLHSSAPSRALRRKERRKASSEWALDLTL